MLHEWWFSFRIWLANQHLRHAWRSLPDNTFEKVVLEQKLHEMAIELAEHYG